MAKFPISLVAALALLTSSFSQTPPATQSPLNPQGEGEVVRVSANLVQVDAVVTDNKGKQVRDLHAEDFEIREDNRSQQITAFSYVSTRPNESNSVTAARPMPPVAKDAPRATTPPLSPNQSQRAMALVVDDLGMSLSSMEFVRPALVRFVDEQMQPGDLVAIVSTSGSLWQPTNDKRLLHAVIDHLHWKYLRNRVGVTALPHYTDNPFNGGEFGSGPESNTEMGDLASTIAVLHYVIDALKALPGRKSLLFFTDDFNPCPRPRPGLTHLGGCDPIQAQVLRKLIEASNRAAVVIHAIDARGLVATSPTAADSTPEDSLASTVAGRVPQGSMTPLADGTWLTGVLDGRSQALLGTQTDLSDLANGTGGFAVLNNNSVKDGIDRVMEDLNGYYLIGYRPAEATFAKHKDGSVSYHEISLLVKRPGLHVRSRRGFDGKIEGEKPAPAGTVQEQMIAAINSPFSENGIRLHLTSLFGNGLSGSFMHVLIHVDARDLTFVDQPDGWHQTVMDTMATSFEMGGRIADQMARTDTLRARGMSYQSILRNGLDYDLVVPLKNVGTFQVRAAVRDAMTKRVGAAFQIVDVPDLKRNRLTLSGITLSKTNLAIESANMFWTTAVHPNATLRISQGLGPNGEPDIQPSAAVRRFQRGMPLEYRYVIYNARPNARSGLPDLTAQLRLFRDGQLVKSEEAETIDRSVLQFDPKRLSAKGRLVLGENLEPGAYVLQILVTDPLAKDQLKTASQWIDFEIVR